ncbi:hypothetical protein BD560DRAFT_490533 [Blakeslea trispora]|nr:hypothetical protein BD560DRAFT_490533 [Blakeslea trispora]
MFCRSPEPPIRSTLSGTQKKIKLSPYRLKRSLLNLFLTKNQGADGRYVLCHKKNFNVLQAPIIPKQATHLKKRGLKQCLYNNNGNTPIEKAWSMTKNLIAHNPNLNKTAQGLKAKLDNKLKKINEESLLPVRKKCINVAKEHQQDSLNKKALKEDKDVEMTSR